MTIDPGLLVNTLSGLNVQSPGQAQEEELLRALAARTQMAAQEAQGAQQQYQGLAAAPPPSLTGLEAFVPTLAANIAATLARDPSYRDRNQQNLTQQRQALLQSRAQNLQSLRDIYSQKAEAAQRSGDLEATEKFRLQQEKIAKTHEQVLEQFKLAGQLARDADAFEKDKELERLKSSLRMREDAAKPSASADAGEDVASYWGNMLAEGRAKLSEVPVGKNGAIRSAAIRWMADNNRVLVPPKVREALEGVSAAEAVIDEIASLSEQVNTAEPGVPMILKGLANQAGAVTQKNTPAAMLETVRGSMAGNLARAVSAERGVLTDQDRAFIMRQLPGLFDSKGLATEKVGIVKRFIAAKKSRAMKYFTAPAKELMAGSEPKAPSPPKHVTMVGPNGQRVPGVKVGSPDYYKAFENGWVEEE